MKPTEIIRVPGHLEHPVPGEDFVPEPHAVLSYRGIEIHLGLTFLHRLGNHLPPIGRATSDRGWGEGLQQIERAMWRQIKGGDSEVDPTQADNGSETSSLFD